MPLTPNAVNHIRRTYARMFSMRAVTVTMYFADKNPKTIQAIWRQQDTADPEMEVQAKPPANPQAATSDGAFEVDLLGAGTSIGELAAAQYFIPNVPQGPYDFGQEARYIAIAIQPKGMMQPPDRAYVQLRRV